MLNGVMSYLSYIHGNQLYNIDGGALVTRLIALICKSVDFLAQQLTVTVVNNCPSPERFSRAFLTRYGKDLENFQMMFK